MTGFLKLKDADWVRQAFLVRKSDLALVDFQNRTFSSASLKFTDTTPGGNIPINPPPQFTRYADPKAPNNYPISKGMGRYYSEAIDDNSQIIHMRFGVPKFNSLTTFFTGFYNSNAGQLARTGRARGAFYYLGRAAGFIVSIMSWQLLAVQLIGVGLRFAMQKPSSKFYYLKPAMPSYWNAVTTMVNQIAVNSGIAPRIGGVDQKDYNQDYEFDAAALNQLHDLLPEIFKSVPAGMNINGVPQTAGANTGGGIDVYAMSTRMQRLARARDKAMEQTLNRDKPLTTIELAKQIQETMLFSPNPIGDGSFSTYMHRWFSAGASEPSPTDAANNPNSTTETTSTDDKGKNKPKDPGFLDFAAAELDDGSGFVSFRVNATGHVSESFSNQVGESEIAQKINGMSSASRSTNFNLAGGNLIGGAVGSAIGAVTSAVSDFGAGVLDAVQISGLAALGGAAFVDIPKHWQSSSAQLPRSSYTISLVSPYGNPISQLLNLHIPLAMLLAGALPISTGKQSWTSPFLVELYDQGRCQTRLGMIDQISITRGTGNLGFNSNGKAMGIDVSFSVIDMSSVLHMPIAEGFSIPNAIVAASTAAGAAIGNVFGTVENAASLGQADTKNASSTGAVVGGSLASLLTGSFDDDTVFSDYMAVLSGMGMGDQIYSSRKLKLNLTRNMANWNSWSSTSHFASMVANFGPVHLASVFFKGTAR